MEGLRLLERLRAYEQDPDRRGVWNADLVMASVLEHLKALLNTRQGSALIAEDLGLPDFTNMIRSFDEMTYDELARHIEQVVEKYEPRLTQTRIEVLPKDDKVLKLKFKIEGKLRVPNADMDISFETVVDPEGKIDLI
ncbi:MAG: type VI secretion system baseplate subunit TssE [Thermodesulfobacteriota bacterium]